MKLLLELRRRQMFRLVGLYIVGAWVVIQVADIAFPTWGIPDSAMRYLFYAALACFPIALVFGWIFDIRSDGIYRTRKAGPDEIVDKKARWQDYVILVALAGVGVSIVLGSMERIRMASEAQPVATAMAVERHDNGVAVLPFENLDPDPETGYFSDGVADEILSSLANIRALHVIGRASSFAFRDSDAQPAVIAGKLGVRYLLSGTVRRDGELVRVTARLLDDEGSHVWSQSFDRKLEQIFAIQTEIAAAVSRRVAREVSPPADPSPARSTENFEAYRHYLLGKQLFHDRAAGWVFKALDLFRKAIELDPDFAPPHAYLAAILGIFGLEHQLEEIEAATRTALELDPNLAEAHVAMALLHKNRDQDPDAAIAAYRRALELDPTLSLAVNQLAISLGEEHRWVEAREVRAQGFTLNPLDPTLMVNVAFDYLRATENEKAEHVVLGLLSLPQTPGYAYHWIFHVYLGVGKIDEAIRFLKQDIQVKLDRVRLESVPFMKTGGGPITEPQWFTGPQWYSGRIIYLARLYALLGLEDDARFWMGQALQLLRPNQRPVVAVSMSMPGMFQQAALCRWLNDLRCLAQHLPELEAAQARGDLNMDELSWLGQLQLINGNVDKSIATLQGVIDLDTISDAQLENQMYWWGLHYLALGHQMTGEDETARQLLEVAGAYGKKWLDTWQIRTSETLMAVAANRWLRGHREDAIELARQAMDAGWIGQYFASWHERLEPLLRELFEQPELQQALAGVEGEIQRQRAVVEAADAAGDFREEVLLGLGRLEQYWLSAVVIDCDQWPADLDQQLAVQFSTSCQERSELMGYSQARAFTLKNLPKTVFDNLDPSSCQAVAEENIAYYCVAIGNP